MNDNPAYHECVCGHPRFEHIGGTDSCARCEFRSFEGGGPCAKFRRKLTFQTLINAIMEAGRPDRMFVPRELLTPVVEMIAKGTPLTAMFESPPRIFGGAVYIDDKLPPNEIAFGFGETKPLRERLVLA